MFIIALIKSTSSKQILKEYCHLAGYGFEFVQSITDLQSTLDMMPDALILEAEFEDVDYEDILADLNLRKFGGRLRILLINNTSDALIDLPHIEAVIEEYALAQHLPLLFHTHIRETKRILYASDDRFMHRVIGDILKKNQFEIIPALNGLDALSLYKDNKPDLILTDLDMPGLSGLELCRTIKIDLLDQSTPVIILSGSNFEEDIQAAFESHAKAYLVKPIPPEKLLHKINSLLNK